MPRRRRAGVKLALGAASIAVGLALGRGTFAYVSEQRVRESCDFHDPYTRFDPELGWAPIPGRSFLSANGTRASSNAAGFRSPPVDDAKGHVLLLGDSVVWGYKVNDDETVSRYLQEMLDRKQGGLQVLNLGVSGYGIDQYCLWLERNLPKISSTRAIVVVITTVNDWRNTGTNVSCGKSKPLFVLGPEGALRNASGRISRLSIPNLTSMWPLSTGLRRFVDRHEGRRETAEGEREKVVLALLARMGTLAAERHARLLFVLSPALEDFRGQGSEDRRRFRELFAGRGYDVIDFKEYLATSEARTWGVYRDPVHYSPAGHRRLAEAIFERLDPPSLLASQR